MTATQTAAVPQAKYHAVTLRPEAVSIPTSSHVAAGRARGIRVTRVNAAVGMKAATILMTQSVLPAAKLTAPAVRMIRHAAFCSAVTRGHTAGSVKNAWQTQTPHARQL